MNRLAKFAAPILLWLIPGVVFALGLGEIHVRSKLNEALDAEIELLYGDPAEPQATEVTLASAEDFRRVGLDRSAMSTRLNFEIGQDAAGRYLIRVTSAQPVADPFVDFLIEVNWPNGRLLREYVVLLDPPVTAPAEVAAVSQPPTAPAPQPAPAPARERGAAEVPAAFDDGGSYEVRRGDTLWEIARDRRPSRDITINQMMMVLYQTNPDAFFRDNISALKAGVVLRMPQLEELEALPVASAISQVRTQNQAWESYRQTWAGRTPTVSEAGVSPEYVGREPAVAGAEDSRLELVPPAADRAAERERAGAAELASLRAELSRSREELVAAGQENGELQSRVDELESLVGNLERAITLKDADLADLQNQVELVGVDTADDSALDAGTEAEAAADPAVSGEDLGAEQLLERELDAVGEPGDEDALAMQDFEDRGEPAGLDDGAGTPVEQTGAADDAAVTPVPTPRPAPGVVDKLLAAVKNPLVLGGLGVAVVLGLGGFLWSRRRGDVGVGESLVDRMMAGGTAIDAEPEAEEVDEDEAWEAEGSSEAQLIAAIDEQPDSAQAHLALLRSYYADEEAEKFAAAAARMRESVGGESHPAWMEVKAMGANLAPNHPLFGAAADEAEAADETPDFERSDSLETAVSRPDFAVADLELEQPDEEEDDLSLDFELEEGDLPSLDAGTDEPEADAQLADDEMSLDFDLGPEIESPEPAEADDLAPLAGEEALGLDLDEPGDELGLGLDLDLGESPDGATAVAGFDDEDDLPELDLDDLELGEETGAAAEPEAGDVDTDFDLQAVTPGDEEVDTELDLDLSLDSEGESITEEQAVDPDQVRKESATLAELESSDEDLGLEDLDLDDKALFGDDDAVGTKLDLAKAYIDMGDPEGARGMLEEVVAEGNPGQKEEAEDLLGRLSG